MKKEINKKTVRILVIMILVALSAFAIFYVFLIDTFRLFTPSQSNPHSNTIDSIEPEEEPLSPAELDKDSSDIPVHGDESSERIFPTEETIIIAKELAQWFAKWYIPNSAKPFPIQEFISQLSSASFSEGNIQPTIMQIPELLTQAVPFFIDALLVEQHNSLPQTKAYRAYLLDFSKQAIIVLDSIRTIAPLQQNDFLEMIRLTQNISFIKKELVNINKEIEELSKNGQSQLLPSLAERKFNAQKTIQEQELVLERYQELFTSFYARAEIRNLPRIVASSIVNAFIYYAPQKEWKVYCENLLVFMNTLHSTLESFELEQ